MTTIVKQTVYWVDGYIPGSWYDDPPTADADLPPVAAEAFHRLWAEDFDSARCQSDNHDPKVRCGVGFGLYGDADEQVRFSPLSIIVETDDVGAETTWYLCEDCSGVLLRKPAETVTPPE